MDTDPGNAPPIVCESRGALVTGGVGGFGKAVAEQLVARKERGKQLAKYPDRLDQAVDLEVAGSLGAPGSIATP